VLLDVPVQCFFATVSIAIVYLLIGLNADHFHNFVHVVAVAMLLANCGAGVGFVISAKVSAIEKALALAPGAIMPQTLLAGFMIDVNSMNLVFRGISYAVFLRYAFQSIMFNEFDCTDPHPSCYDSWVVQEDKSCSDSPCPYCCEPEELVGVSKICPVTTCDSGLSSLGLTGADTWPKGDTALETVRLNLLMLFCLTCFIRCMGYVAVMSEMKKLQKGA